MSPNTSHLLLLLILILLFLLLHFLNLLLPIPVLSRCGSTSPIRPAVAAVQWCSPPRADAQHRQQQQQQQQQHFTPHKWGSLHVMAALGLARRQLTRERCTPTSSPCWAPRCVCKCVWMLIHKTDCWIQTAMVVAVGQCCHHLDVMVQPLSWQTRAGVLLGV